MAKSNSNTQAASETRMKHGESLKFTKAHYRVLFETNPIPMAIYDQDSLRILAANEAATKTYGWTKEEFRRLTVLDIRPKEDCPILLEFLRKFPLVNGKEVPHSRHCRKDGSIMDMRVVVSSIMYEGRRCRLCSMEDMSERNRLKRDLDAVTQEAHAITVENSAILDAVPAGVMVAHDRASKVITANQQAYDWMRLSQGENSAELESFPASVTSRRYESFSPQIFRICKNGLEIPKQELPLRKSAREGIAIRECEFQMVYQDGSVRHLFGNVVPIFDEAGSPSGSAGAFIDISALKEAEARQIKATEELEQKVSERTAQLRELTIALTNAEESERRRVAKILHDDLQQLLLAANIHLGLAQKNGGLEGKNRALALAADLVDSAMKVARSLSHDLSLVVLHEQGLIAALEWLVLWCQRNLGLSVEFVPKTFDEPENEYLRTAIFQSVRELLVNVKKHAGTDSAKIKVSVTRRGDYVLEVSDQGKGLAPKDLRQATRGRYGIFSLTERLHSLGGEVDFISAPGKGCRVILTASREVLGALKRHKSRL
jgi:PAS domain S-box-containing protein